MARQLMKKTKTFTPRAGETELFNSHPLQNHNIFQSLPFKALPGVTEELRSPGHMLDKETRRFVEPLFNFDFSHVRIHTDKKAAESAQALHAHAYAVGRNVVFGAGHFAPRTASGKKLLGHELAHVMQQNTRDVPSPDDIIPTDFLHNIFEPEADAAGNNIMNNRAPSGIKPGVNKPAILQGSFGEIPVISTLISTFYRLFGGESYTKDELQKYLNHLKTGEIENNFDSDNKARAVVKRQDEFPSLDTEIKELLIREMLKGLTACADEESIIRLLREAEPGERTKLVAAIGRSLLWDNFSGDNRITIEAITLTHSDFYDQTLVNRLMKLPIEKLNLYRQKAIDPAVKAGIDQIIRMKGISTPSGKPTQISWVGDAVQITLFTGMTPWKLTQQPQTAFTPVGSDPPARVVNRFADFERAKRLAQAVFNKYSITFDIDSDSKVLGRVPTAAELAVLNRNLVRVLNLPNVRSLVSGKDGRGIPGSAGSPSLKGKVRVAQNATEFGIKRYQLDMTVLGLSGLKITEPGLDKDVRQLWQHFKIPYGKQAAITDQERMVTHLFNKIIMKENPAFYHVGDDIIYLESRFNLKEPGTIHVARHETVHLIGGRDRTRKAFVTRYGHPRYIKYWVPFEEGMVELLARESKPSGQSLPPTTTSSTTTRTPTGSTTVSAITGPGYEREVQIMKGIMNHPGVGRQTLLRAYFTGIIPAIIFQQLENTLGKP